MIKGEINYMKKTIFSALLVFLLYPSQVTAESQATISTSISIGFEFSDKIYRDATEGELVEPPLKRKEGEGAGKIFQKFSGNYE